MTKTEKLNLLFDEWNTRNPEYKGLFVKDGIIDEPSWNTLGDKSKILFIAKEANHGDSPGAADFRNDWTNDKTWYSFKYRVAEWAHGILNRFPPIDEIYYDKEGWPQIYTHALKHIAFMNIKKRPGIGRADHGVLTEDLAHNKELVLRQIEIISPSIIICSIVDQSLVSALFDLKPTDWIRSGYIRCIFKWRNIPVVDFYHPSSMNTPAASYSLLQNIVQSTPFKALLK